MKKYVIFLMLLIPTLTFAGEQKTLAQIRDLFNEAAKDKVKILQIDSCSEKKSPKAADRTYMECTLGMENALLSIFASNNKATDATLMIDATQLEHPSDLIRAASLFVRVARGGEAFGNSLAVGESMLLKSKDAKGALSCLIDEQSKAKLCAGSNERHIYDFGITF